MAKSKLESVGWEEVDEPKRLKSTHDWEEVPMRGETSAGAPTNPMQWLKQQVQNSNAQDTAFVKGAVKAIPRMAQNLYGHVGGQFPQGIQNMLQPGVEEQEHPYAAGLGSMTASGVPYGALMKGATAGAGALKSLLGGGTLTGAQAIGSRVLGSGLANAATGAPEDDAQNFVMGAGLQGVGEAVPAIARGARAFKNDLKKVPELVTEGVDNALTGIREYLNPKAPHHVQAASKINAKMDEINKAAASNFKAVTDAMREQNYELPHHKEFDAYANRDINKLLLSYTKRNEPIPKDINRLISLVPNLKDKNAADFFDKELAFSNELNELIGEKNNKISPPSAERRRELTTVIESVKPIKGLLNEMKEGDLGHFTEPYKEARKFYSEIVHPMRANSVVKTAASNGKLGKDMIEQLAGSNPDQELLRSVIKEDPALVKHIVGQAFAKKPENILNQNELQQEWTQHLPDLHDLTQTYSKEIEALTDMSKRRDISLAAKMKAEKKLKLLKKIGYGVGLPGVGAAFATHDFSREE